MQQIIASMTRQKLLELALSPAGWVVVGLLLLPVAWPLLAILLPIGALALLVGKEGKAEGPTSAADGEKAGGGLEPSKVDLEVTPSALHPAPTPGAAQPTPPPATAQLKLAAPKPMAAALSDSEQSERIGTAPAVAPSAGGAAILAKLRAQREAKAAAGKGGTAPKEVVVLYASQTGTAQEIARGVQAEAESQGLNAKVASMNEFGFENLTADKAPIVVMVASSTGDGDPPDNAAKFYMAVRRKSNANNMLEGIQFTVMGLGDSNYTRFCHVPRTLRSRFLDLGAAEFYPSADADEVDGLENAVEKWLEGLWPQLKAVAKPGAGQAAEGAAAAADAGELKGVPALPRCRVRLVWEDSSYEAAAVRQQEAEAPPREEASYRDLTGMYSADAPLWAPVSGARYLTTEVTEDRKVLHLELDISGSNMDYHPGDSIGVLPQNSDALVDGLIRRLGLDGDAVFAVEPAEGGAGEGVALLPHLKAPCSVRYAFKRGCDLTSVPRKSLLRLLAEHCSDSKDKFRLLLLCSRDGKEAYSKEILEAKPNLLDLLTEFPSCGPPLGALLDALPALPARMYSLACSPLELPDKVQVAFSVVRYDSKYGPKEGVATSWLERLLVPVTSGKRPAAKAGIQLPIFLRRGGDFKPPKDLSRPVIMIGPGTGVAPFRGFLQHRRSQLEVLHSGGSGSKGAAGESWLFFGCRREDQDYLYKEDLKAFCEDGTLSKLFVAFSRAQAHKVYVQDLMRAHSRELYRLMVEQEAFVFVCGDGAAMAKDVQACLVEIVEREGGVAAGEAAEVLAEMARQKRYVRDIWS